MNLRGYVVVNLRGIRDGKGVGYNQNALYLHMKFQGKH